MKKRFLVKEIIYRESIREADTEEELRRRLVSRQSQIGKTKIVISELPPKSRYCPSLIRHEDFVEMLIRGDSLERIADVAKVKVSSVVTRIDRLSIEERNRVKRARINL